MHLVTIQKGTLEKSKSPNASRYDIKGNAGEIKKPECISA